MLISELPYFEDPEIMDSSSNDSIQSVTRTSLTALVRRTIHNDREYPAVVEQTLEERMYACVLDPVLRAMRSDHPGLEISATIQISGINLQKGDRVLVQRQEKQWVATTTLTEALFERKQLILTVQQLIAEGAQETPPLIRRTAKRRFEKWFGIEANEATPWGLPGRLEEGNTRLSRSLLKWCARHAQLQSGAFEDAVRRALPRKEEWGNGPLYFVLFPVSDDKVRFSAVVLEQDEHQMLFDRWKGMMEQPVKKQHLHIVKATPADLPVARAKDAFTQGSLSKTEDLTQALTLPSRQRKNQDALLITEEPSIFFPFPAHLANLIQGLSLPLPPQPMTEGMSTLVAWTESDHPALKGRVTDFLLMILAEGEEVHPNPELHEIWQRWHRTTEPIERLALLVRDGEEPAALRALVGRPAPGPETAAALTDFLLERWKSYVLVNAPSDRQVQRKKHSTLIDFRTSLRRR